MNISVHIERLILDGVQVAPSQRPLLQTAVEVELARLLETYGLSRELLAGGALPSLETRSMQLAGSDNPTQLGQHIAQAVYGSIGNVHG